VRFEPGFLRYRRWQLTHRANFANVVKYIEAISGIPRRQDHLRWRVCSPTASWTMPSVRPQWRPRPSLNGGAGKIFATGYFQFAEVGVSRSFRCRDPTSDPPAARIAHAGKLTGGNQIMAAVEGRAMRWSRQNPAQPAAGARGNVSGRSRWSGSRPQAPCLLTDPSRNGNVDSRQRLPSGESQINIVRDHANLDRETEQNWSDNRVFHT
jgi:hypothetical protein